MESHIAGIASKTREWSSENKNSLKAKQAEWHPKSCHSKDRATDATQHPTHPYVWPTKLARPRVQKHTAYSQQKTPFADIAAPEGISSTLDSASL